MTQGELFEEFLEEPKESSTTQLCPDCKEVKDASEFYVYENRQQTGSLRRCKPCFIANVRLTQRLKKENPYPHKNPVCECCGSVPEDKLQLDHCHMTHVFRGWLCRSCNTGIGALGDDIEGVKQGLTYLKGHYEKRS